MSKEVLDIGRPFGDKPLIAMDGYYVMISHKELDGLIGNLMHLLDLNSDQQFREAMKSEIKSRTRAWLDSEYADAGYEHYALADGANVLEVPVPN